MTRALDTALDYATTYAQSKGLKVDREVEKMKMKSIFLSLLIISVLLLSALAFSLPAVRAQSKGSDWALPFADIGGTNYSPQTVINKQNVGQLEVKWIFPLNEPALPGYIKIYGVV